MSRTSRVFQPGRLARIHTFIAALLLAILACARTDIPLDYGRITPLPGSNAATQAVMLATQQGGAPTATLEPAPPPVANLPLPTPRPTLDTSASPTPDPLRASALDRQNVEPYTVQRGDSLSGIGERYGVTAAQIADANGIGVTDTLHIGQVLLIPLPEGQPVGPDWKLLPDSEFVYGPGAFTFNVQAYARSQFGFLADYYEDVPGHYLDGAVESARLSGSEIVQMVAQRYSVNPRLLLAVLEYQSGWVRNPHPGDNTLAYPLRQVEAGREGLFRQLSWAANQLNLGYYAWRAGWLVSFAFGDGSLRIIAPGLNAGTAGVQHLFAQVYGPDAWTHAVSADGFFAIYRSMFGNPFAYAIEPLVPPDLIQPELHLPFESGKVWAFTGGPHGAWDSGSAWAALDFAPPALAEGCLLSDEWVAASAPGLIVRSQHGAVIQDLDGDGDEGSGWALFYMHVEARDRVAVGARLNAGDHIGHPSCEGGISNGTHLHLARKYNGEWIAADGPVPFVLDGWVSTGLGREYDGLMVSGDQSLEACDCRATGNEISRP
jgi:LysM repeat protein